MNQKLTGKQEAHFSVAIGLVTTNIPGNCPAELGSWGLWSDKAVTGEADQSPELEATPFFEMRSWQGKPTHCTGETSSPLPYHCASLLFPCPQRQVWPHAGATSEDEDGAAPSCLAQDLTALLPTSSSTAMADSWCPVLPLCLSQKQTCRADVAWVRAMEL